MGRPLIETVDGPGPLERPPRGGGGAAREIVAACILSTPDAAHMHGPRDRLPGTPCRRRAEVRRTGNGKDPAQRRLARFWRVDPEPAALQAAAARASLPSSALGWRLSAADHVVVVEQRVRQVVELASLVVALSETRRCRLGGRKTWRLRTAMRDPSSSPSPTGFGSGAATRTFA